MSSSHQVSFSDRFYLLFIMAFCCSQCNFTAQFESALLMHRQLHHENSCEYPDLTTKNILLVLSATRSRSPILYRERPHRGHLSPFAGAKALVSWLQAHTNSLPVAGRTASATRLFSNLKAKICRSKTLFSHPEEANESCLNVRGNNSKSRSIYSYPGSVPSGCTSKGLKVESTASSLTACIEDKETFGCHLCSFEADRITVLDRHLLNHHKIGLENLLKLVMAKTKDGLSDAISPSFGIRQPYYKLQDEIFDEGEFIIETIAPKIKIVKHASTNTEQSGTIDNFKAIASEIENLFKMKQDGVDGQDGFMAKMATLNECMCKFVDSSNTLKKVLNKELDSKANLRDHLSGNEPIFNLGLGDRDTPREWERAHSEKMERSRRQCDSSRGEKGKLSTSESYYF